MATPLDAEPGVGAAYGSALLVDLYELTMAEAYVREGMADAPATFSLFCRSLPRRWGYLLAAGLDDVLRILEQLRFREEELAYLEHTRRFSPRLLERLRSLRFTGDVRALPEGTAFFPQEPVLEVTAPVVEAQLVEGLIMNQIHHQTLVTSKAARCVEAARARTLVDFALRRAPGAEAGLRVARSSYLAGFDATSNVLAGRAYGIPTAGTMAHSFVECFADETDAFRAFARAFPDAAVLLVDTYDTVEGTRRATTVARELVAAGSRLGGVRLDSGDLLALSRRARELLDAGGFDDVTIFASGGLDEIGIDGLLAAGAPIDGFGVGSKVGVSADAPYLDMAYKLVAFDGRPCLKLSEGKATLPGPKQVWRSEEQRVPFDVVDVATADPPPAACGLLVDVMSGGRRLWHDTLEDARSRAERERRALPAPTRRLAAAPYDVRLGRALVVLTEKLTAEARRRAAGS